MSYTEEKKKKRAKPRQMLKNSIFMFRYIYRFAPGYFAVNLVEAIGRAGFNIFQILYIKYIFDAIEKDAPMSEILLFSAAFAGYIAVFQWLVNWRKQVYCPGTNRELHARIQGELYRHACELDASCYDDPEFYDDFTWAIRETDKRAIRMLSLITQIINCFLSAIGVLVVIASVDVVVGILILTSVVLSFLLRHLLNVTRYQKELELNPVNRKLGYIGRIFYLPDHAKELRQGNIAELLKRRYSDTTEEKEACVRKYSARILWLSLLSDFATTMLMDLGIVLYLIIRFLSAPGALSLGDFSASVSAMYKLYWELRRLGDYVNEYSEQCLYVERVKKFIDAKPTVVGTVDKIPPMERLTLCNVGFSYPGADEEPVLRHVDLEIRRGERIAFVGYNGAGKTTLIKLLLRLYDPTEGRILYNGVDIKEFVPQNYRRGIGAVFQDYRIFAASLAENVMGGGFEKEDEEAVLGALHAASFDDKLASLPNGIHTCLLREFDPNGVGLSGGEAQKVAIARVFVRPYELMILDEPSSALDPIAEYELNQSILQNAVGRTVIFISHRLSTTRMADRIYMFDGGEIAESGSHEELMALDGKYAEMYRVQAKKYASK